MKPSRIVEFSTLEAKCAYLDNKRMRVEYKFIENCPELLSQKLIQRGWRRFGEYYSKPNCVGCNDCFGLSVVTGTGTSLGGEDVVGGLV